LRLGVFLQQGIDAGMAGGHIFNLRGLTPGVNAVDINIGDGFFERVERMRGIIFRTEQAFLFGCGGNKQDRTFRCFRQCFICFRQFH
jgi:hypothetical protein